MRADRNACVVTGATGWLGGCLVEELVRRDSCDICVLVRRKGGVDQGARLRRLQELAHRSGRLSIIEWDNGARHRLPVSTTHVIHAAAEVAFTSSESMLASNVGLTWDMLMQATRLPSLKRIIHVSTLSIRGDSRRAFSEKCLDEGQSFLTAYALTKYMAEIAVRRFHEHLPTTVVRMGSILARSDGAFGARRDWFYQTVRLLIGRDISAVPLGSSQRIWPIPVDSAARAICEIADLEDVPPVLHVPYDGGPPMQEVFGVICAELEIPLPTLYAQHSAEWASVYAGMAPAMRRVLDRIYPPVREGSVLAEIDSQFSGRWLTQRSVIIPELPALYWRSLASAVRRDIIAPGRAH